MLLLGLALWVLSSAPICLILGPLLADRGGR